jgi:hypothetical protein
LLNANLLPQEEQTAARAEQEAADAQERRVAPMNFCGFLEGGSNGVLYTGRDGVGSFCEDLLARAGVTVAGGRRVLGAEFDAAAGGGWTLEVSVGFGRIAILHHRSFAVYRIH